MSSDPFRHPDQALDRLVAAGVELIYARDAALAAALNVPAPLVEDGDHPQIESSPARGLAYRVARKIYRTLKNNRYLKPLLERVRHEVLTRT